MTKTNIYIISKKEMNVKLLSRVWLFATPWTVTYQAPPSRQEYWSGLPFPSPGDLPDLGIEPGSPAFQADTLPSEPPGKPTRGILIVSCCLRVTDKILTNERLCHHRLKYEIQWISILIKTKFDYINEETHI